MGETMTPAVLKEAAKIVEALEEELERAAYHNKTGDHIQIEEDKIYFSVVGMSCNHDELAEYKVWEETRYGLRSILRRLEPEFFNFEFRHMGTHLEIEPKYQ